MNLDQFYDQDDRRRQSEEVEFGIGWSDSNIRHHSFDIYWVRDTGEVYSMTRPPIKEWRHFSEDANEDELDVEDMTVEVLAVVPDEDKVTELLDGWEDHVREENSLAWAKARLAST